MEAAELEIAGAAVFTPRQHRDDRGVFLEQFRADVLAEAVGVPLTLAQSNVSVSRRGVLRGIHFAQVPPGQAKYVTCQRGEVLDVVVDLRVGSPTFGRSASVLLDDRTRRALYIAEGLGHAFLARTDEATVSYFCSTPFAPGREHAISVFDPDLALTWPGDVDLVLSDKDRDAPTLAEAQAAGLLPDYAECLTHYTRLRERGVPTHAGLGQ